MDDARQYAPATARNREPILAVLRRVLPATGRVLEIASGSGEHAVFFAGAMPGLQWQPSDPHEGARQSIAAWIAHAKLPNVLPPLAIDAAESDWGAAGPFDAVLAVNMIHISPWRATLGLFAGAARLLAPGGLVFLYGAYRRDGRHTSPSNEAFEQWLKGLDPAYGVRDLADVEKVANANGFALRQTVEMPANNFSVVFAR